MAADPQQQAAVECPFALLDSATILAIVGFLDDAKDLASLQRVNRELNELLSGNIVWLPLLASEHGLHLQASASIPTHRDSDGAITAGAIMAGAIWMHIWIHHFDLHVLQDSEAVKAQGIAKCLKGSRKVAVHPIRFHGLFTDGA
jgi:hypothetical protein